MNTTLPPSKPESTLSTKLIFSGLLLILFSMFPGVYIGSLIEDREATRDQAVEDISGKWGATETLTGPVLIVPYQENVDGAMQTNYAHFLPENLDIKGSVDTEIRNRGIYKVPVYTSTLIFSGDFKAPGFASLGVDEKNVLWSDAYVALGLNDLKGMQAVSLVWDSETKTLDPGIADTKLLTSGVSSPVPMTKGKITSHTFQVDLTIRGSKEIYFTTVGANTTVNISSNWTNPSFDGTFLPENYEITKDGFTASWDVLYLNRGYPQEWKGSDYSFTDSTLGVKLFTPTDSYQMVTRSVKYIALFIFLTFFSFFFVEILSHAKLHPVQYGLVGLALVLFYVLLLSLSEHISFGVSYVIATAAVVGLIAAYSKGILQSQKLAGIIGTILILLYGALYVILQLTDYALLIGSLLLFITLAIVMYLTRKIDWYRL